MRITLSGLNNSLLGTGYRITKAASFSVYDLEKIAYVPGESIDILMRYCGDPDRYGCPGIVYRPLAKVLEDKGLMRLIEANTAIQSFDIEQCTNWLDKVEHNRYIPKLDLINQYIGEYNFHPESFYNVLFPKDILYMFNYRCQKVIYHYPEFKFQHIKQASEVEIERLKNAGLDLSMFDI